MRVVGGHIVSLATRLGEVAAVGVAVVLLSGCSSPGRDVEALAPVDMPARGMAADLTYEGVMPCADCGGVHQTITFHTDGTYVLRSVYLGEEHEPFVERGDWDVHSGQIITLYRDGEASLFYRVVDPSIICMQDINGDEIESDLNYELRRVRR